MTYEPVHQVVIGVPRIVLDESVWQEPICRDFCVEHADFLYTIATGDEAISLTGHLSDVQRWATDLYDTMVTGLNKALTDTQDTTPERDRDDNEA